MARLLLRGAALLGCLLVLRGDPVCDVALEKYAASDPNKVGLHCVVTGSVISVTWTRGGSGIPVTPTQSESQLLEVPLEEATGVFECHVQCTQGLSRSAQITLDLSDTKEADISRGKKIITAIGVLILVMIFLNIGCFYRRRYRRRRRAACEARRSSRRDPTGYQGANGQAVMLTELPIAAAAV